MSKAEEYFVNDRYKLLKMMSENETSVRSAKFVKLTQQEISEILNFAKVKVNVIMKELTKAGYIVKVARGRYSITDEGYKVIKTISKL